MNIARFANLICDSLKLSDQYCNKRDEDFVALEIDNFLFKMIPSS